MERLSSRSKPRRLQMPSRKSVSADACNSAIRRWTSASSAFSSRMVCFARPIALDRSASARAVLFARAAFAVGRLLFSLVLLLRLLLALLLALLAFTPALAASPDVVVLRRVPAAWRRPLASSARAGALVGFFIDILDCGMLLRLAGISPDRIVHSPSFATPRRPWA